MKLDMNNKNYHINATLLGLVIFTITGFLFNFLLAQIFSIETSTLTSLLIVMIGLFLVFAFHSIGTMILCYLIGVKEHNKLFKIYISGFLGLIIIYIVRGTFDSFGFLKYTDGVYLTVIFSLLIAFIGFGKNAIKQAVSISALVSIPFAILRYIFHITSVFDMLWAFKINIALIILLVSCGTSIGLWLSVFLKDQQEKVSYTKIDDESTNQ